MVTVSPIDSWNKGMEKSVSGFGTGRQYVKKRLVERVVMDVAVKE
jgi:hypothetical protein